MMRAFRLSVCQALAKVREQNHRLAAAVILGTLLVSCSLSSPPLSDPATDLAPNGSPGPAAAKTVVVALAQAPTSLDPADHRDRPSEIVIRSIYDALVTRDESNGLHLQLAESLIWLDELTLEVKLRQGVLFHDGTPLTADDVVFSFERIIISDAIEYPEPHSSPRKGLVSPLEKVEAIDDLTVRMHLSHPWPVAIEMLAHQQIVPRRYMLRVGTRGLLKQPIGCGPFRFVTSDRELREIVLERFPDYYGGSPDLPPTGPAAIDHVVFRVVEDPMTRVAALHAGQVQIIQAVPSELIDQIASWEGLQLGTAAGTQPLWMDLNVRSAPFDDVRVRQALNHAIDKQRLITKVYAGCAEELAGPLSPHNHYAHPELEPYAYDPGAALRLLSQSGWDDADGDGVLDREGTAFELTIDTLAEWQALAQEIALQLSAVGIRANVRLWDHRVIRPLVLTGQRLAYLDDWGDSAFDPIGHFDAKWHSQAGSSAYGQANFSGYHNMRVDELIELGESTNDVTVRQSAYYEAQEIIYHDAPAVFLILPEQVEAASADLIGWSPSSDSHINLQDIRWSE